MNGATAAMLPASSGSLWRVGASWCSVAPREQVRGGSREDHRAVRDGPGVQLAWRRSDGELTPQPHNHDIAAGGTERCLRPAFRHPPLPRPTPVTMRLTGELIADR